MGVTTTQREYNVQPFHIDISEGVSHMMDLISKTNLPERPEYPGVGDTAGIDLQTLKSLKAQWSQAFNWETEQAGMNQYDQLCRFSYEG